MKKIKLTNRKDHKTNLLLFTQIHVIFVTQQANLHLLVF